jgi:putative intracellular protease/amidase
MILSCVRFGGVACARLCAAPTMLASFGLKGRDVTLLFDR